MLAAPPTARFNDFSDAQQRTLSRPLMIGAAQDDVCVAFGEHAGLLDFVDPRVARSQPEWCALSGLAFRPVSVSLVITLLTPWDVRCALSTSMKSSAKLPEGVASANVAQTLLERIDRCADVGAGEPF